MPFYKISIFIISFVLLLSNCSTKQLEQNFIDSLASKLSNNESNVFRGEEDPELMGASLPFMLKMLEIMSENSPENVNMKISLAQGFTAYSSLWIENDALINEDENFEYSEQLKYRSKKFYRRAWQYGFEGFELQYPGLLLKIEKDVSKLSKIKKEGVPLLTWTGLALISWIKHSTENSEALSKLPIAVSMLNRAFALDPEYGDGVLYEFFINYYSEQVNNIDKKKQLVDYRNKLIDDSDNNKCTPYLTWATAISIKTQDKQEFVEMLKKGLKIDSDKRPEYRLSNKICQKMSKWYLKNIDDFFL